MYMHNVITRVYCMIIIMVWLHSSMLYMAYIYIYILAIMYGWSATTHACLGWDEFLRVGGGVPVNPAPGQTLVSNFQQSDCTKVTKRLPKSDRRHK